MRLIKALCLIPLDGPAINEAILGAKATFLIRNVAFLV